MWINMGPTPIQSTVGCSNYGKGNLTGRISDVVVAVGPSDNNHWLIGGAVGVAWETHDLVSTHGRHGPMTRRVWQWDIIESNTR